MMPWEATLSARSHAYAPSAFGVCPFSGVITSWSPLGEESRARSACARRFSRFRPDRELPNDVSVFKRVNDALQEGLDEEELLAKIDQFSAEASSASASGGRGQKRPHE